ncbi:MAG: class B sortase [Coriobacteriales bacterium]|jgi:sortase B|nr:class B sortase [Coriobacteriales bacterium]
MHKEDNTEESKKRRKPFAGWAGFLKKKNIGEDAVRKDAVRKDTVRDDAVLEDSARDDEVRKEGSPEEAAPKSDLLSRLLVILGILLLLLAFSIAGYLVWQYTDAQNRYTQIQSTAGLEVTQSRTVDRDTKLEDLRFDWDALRALNPEVVAWIIVPGTNINYPVVQGADNSYYLYHLFDASYSGTGSIFADFEGSKTLDGQHNIIYGHNMFDGSMFSDIFLYTNQDYFDDHRVLYLCTPEKNIELSAISCIKISADAGLRQFYFETPEDFTAFVFETLSASVASTSNLQSVIYDTQTLYSFVTCGTLDASTRITLCCIPVRSVTPSAL